MALYCAKTLLDCFFKVHQSVAVSGIRKSGGKPPHSKDATGCCIYLGHVSANGAKHTRGRASSYSGTGVSR